MKVICRLADCWNQVWKYQAAKYVSICRCLEIQLSIQCLTIDIGRARFSTLIKQHSSFKFSNRLHLSSADLALLLGQTWSKLKHLNFVEIQILFEAEQWKDEINGYKLQQGKFWFYNTKKCFHHEGSPTWAWRGWEVSILGVILNLTGQQPKQPDLSWSCLKLGLDKMVSRGPSQLTLLCDLWPPNIHMDRSLPIIPFLKSKGI